MMTDTPPRFFHERIKHRGFTLVECLVALMMLATGALAISRLQWQIGVQADVARQRSEAIHLAQQKIEQLRSASTSTLTAGADTPALGANTTYARWWTVDAAPGGAAYRLVTVNVGWTARNDEPQFAALTTVIAPYDPAEVARLHLQTSATPARIDKPVASEGASAGALTTSGAAATAPVPPAASSALPYVATATPTAPLCHNGAPEEDLTTCAPAPATLATPRPAGVH